MKFKSDEIAGVIREEIARYHHELDVSDVGQVLGTRAASSFTEGELPWRPDFGSLLHQLKHQQNNEILGELARVHVIDALRRWDDRIEVTNVFLERSIRTPNRLLISVEFNVVDINSGTPIQEGLLTQISV